MAILQNTPALFLMILSLFGFLSGEMIKCDYTRKTGESEDRVFFYTFAISAICVCLMLALWGFRYPVSLYTVLSAALFGLAVMGQIAASAFAMKIGPWAYTAVMMSLSSVIPALAGPLLFNEPLGIFTVIGIALTMVCFVLSVKSQKDDAQQKRTNLLWFLLSLLASLCTGGIGILQKANQSSPYKQELAAFLTISFACSAAFSLLGAYLLSHKAKRKLAPRSSFSALFFVAGIGTALNHLINLFLSGAMASAIFFPMMSGGELIFVTLTSVLFFKERLSLKQWIGLICGILAVIIFCIE